MPEPHPPDGFFVEGRFWFGLLLILAFIALAYLAVNAASPLSVPPDALIDMLIGAAAGFLGGWWSRRPDAGDA